MQIKQLIKIYPFNLARKILCSEEAAEKIYIPGISAALVTLTDREQGILRYRYVEGWTLQKCAEAYGVGRERIRQIEAKAIRKLRHPSRANMFKAVSLSEVQEQDIKYKQLSREYELLSRAFELCTERRAEPGVIIPMAELAVTMQTPLEDLNFSVRTYNCLRRAGKNTLREITEMTMDELQRVRNLGRKSAEEIVACVRKYGLDMRMEDTYEH